MFPGLSRGGSEGGSSRSSRCCWTNFQTSHAFAFFPSRRKFVQTISQFRLKNYTCVFSEGRAVNLYLFFDHFFRPSNGAFQSHPHPSVKSRDREIQRTYLPVTGSSRRYNERSCTVTYEKRVYTKRGGGYT